MIAERALAKELQVSVNHNDLGYLEKALEHLLSAENCFPRVCGLDLNRLPGLSTLAVQIIISERGLVEADLDMSCCDFGGLRFLPLFAKELPLRDSRGGNA